MGHWSLWIFITNKYSKPKAKEVSEEIGDSEASYTSEQLVSAHLVDLVSHEGLGMESLTFRKVQVACETLRGPVTTGLYHEGSTSTGVKEGGPPSPKAMTAIKVRVIASLL